MRYVILFVLLIAGCGTMNVTDNEPTRSGFPIVNEAVKVQDA